MVTIPVCDFVDCLWISTSSGCRCCMGWLNTTARPDFTVCVLLHFELLTRNDLLNLTDPPQSPGLSFIVHGDDLSLNCILYPLTDL